MDTQFDVFLFRDAEISSEFVRSAAICAADFLHMENLFHLGVCLLM